MVKPRFRCRHSGFILPTTLKLSSLKFQVYAQTTDTNERKGGAGKGSALYALIYLILTTSKVGSACEVRTIMQERKLRYRMVK